MHRATWDTFKRSRALLTRLSRSLAHLSIWFSSHSTCYIKVPLPQTDKSIWFGLLRFRSPLLTESCHFIFLRLLRCFTSPRVALLDYEFIQSMMTFTSSGFPIRKFTGQSLLAASRDLSQLAASFIASWHQGIRHKLLLA